MENQIGLDCIALISRKLGHQMTPDEYYIALMELHNRYPLRGHWPPLSRESMENYKALNLQPENFKEAAEMYSWSRRRVNVGTS